MFTGIIEEIGIVAAVDALEDSTRVRFLGPLVVSDAVHGSSIAVNGVCLTVVEHDHESFTADVMGQTLAMTALSGLEPGDRVNLERSVRADQRLSGHVVQGHVDGVGSVIAIAERSDWAVLRIAAPRALAHYIADKGSITVNGTSLTVSAVSEIPSTALTPGNADEQDETWFEVSLIPETLRATTLGELQVGDRVNLETDVLAKYLERLLAGGVS
jgi:riboflavin synthase